MKKEEDIQELNFIKWGKCAVKGLFNKLIFFIILI